jgi:hypothetical protein
MGAVDLRLADAKGVEKPSHAEQTNRDQITRAPADTARD